MSIFSDLLGTTKSFFKLGLTGVRLKNTTGNLFIRNTGDTADAEVTASKVNVSGESLVINSDSAGAGADWKITLARPITGMTADVSLTLPVDDGTPSQALITDGAGILSWASTGSTASSDKIDTTTLAFGTTSPLTLFSTGAADIIDSIDIVVDTAFNGTAPTVTIGITGVTSKYSATTDVDLKTVGVYQIHPGLVAQGAEALIATYVADTSTAGSARILVHFATPA
jgi:hypothetical protein